MKTFIKVLIILGILAIVFMLGVNYFISKMFDREAVIFAVEQNMDTRFDVQDISVNIFSTTPSIHLEDIKFAPRDQYADDKIKVDDRPEISTETAYFSVVELNIDIPHLIKTENEIISELTIGEGTSISSSGILKELKSSLAELSDAGLNLNVLSEKLVLKEDLEIKTIFVDGKISFLEDLKLKTADCDIALTKNSWFDISDNSHKFEGIYLMSEERSRLILKDVDRIIDEKTAKIINRGYIVDKNSIKTKLFNGMIKDNRIYVKFTSQGDISAPDFTIMSKPESFEQIVEDAVREAIK